MARSIDFVSRFICRNEIVKIVCLITEIICRNLQIFPIFEKKVKHAGTAGGFLFAFGVSRPVISYL